MPVKEKMNKVARTTSIVTLVEDSRKTSIIGNWKVDGLEVEDDPVLWKPTKKLSVLLIVSSTALVGLLGSNIYLPALDIIQEEFQCDGLLISASISLFALGQGFFPLFWTGLSELLGRKRVYLASLVVYIAASLALYFAKNISAFIGLRVLQSFGSSSALALGATSIADVYRAEERGSKLGIFVAIPLLAPAIGPVIGGAISRGAGWRPTFLFLVAYGTFCLVLMLFIPETYRKERSAVWQKAAFRASETNSKVELTLRDANPFPSAWQILVKPGGTNALALVASSLLFALQYTISFSSSRSFGNAPYFFDPLKIGFVLLSFGGAAMIGSIAGGKWSDIVLRKSTEANDGIGYPEMRLSSTFFGIFLVPSILAYAWLLSAGLPIQWLVICLIFMGMSVALVYASTLSYLVDSNPGLVSATMAVNTLCRGILATIGTQVSNPIVGGIGEGWFWTIFSILILFAQMMILLVYKKGKGWREGGNAGAAEGDGIKIIKTVEQIDEQHFIRRLSTIA